ncbi:hypothetical protein L2E82_19556 [Cichorium intybus]|uniref:Uncharacterized protein n=1 Tax=Cichorium intybus TaxID=13427 RepID=A0ACB9FCK2_CICIN|nr:hypothetical protein L2E82_19556 [Cichorium intybus]
MFSIDPLRQFLVIILHLYPPRPDFDRIPHLYPLSQSFVRVPHLYPPRPDLDRIPHLYPPRQFPISFHISIIQDWISRGFNIFTLRGSSSSGSREESTYVPSDTVPRQFLSTRLSIEAVPCYSSISLSVKAVPYHEV